MPLFEYQCVPCRERFEILASRADEAAPPCPRCGGAEVRRLLSTFAVTKGQPKPGSGACGSADCACRSS